MQYLYLIMAALLFISFLFDREKTWKSIKRGKNKLVKILPGYLKLLVLLSLVLFFSEDLIVQYLGTENVLLGSFIGLILGSITMMPGFIAYPLAGILLSQGVSFMVIASFIIPLKMVGVLTYPLEKEYMGIKATVYRNTASLVIAAILTLLIGLYYGEVII
ncbi:hypothetical protein [Halarsenatibacter silvermanii]|uniref:Permease n=1 Tax=Halarsenatibacter silvermanii TaxID=321763 RepID=A0A1G9IXN5_9FIRM|nr:hypothetical protein [Halarsenatibacter silvermanii]SDL29845.1 hypothetical protein SAMN04488692_10386 [Halarsenatibacter silvermanii]